MVVVADNMPQRPHPKSSASARFQGRREVVVVADNMSASKSSTYAQFRGWREVVESDNTPHSKSSVHAQFRGRRGGGVADNMLPSISRAERGGDDSEHTTCVHPCF